MTNRDHLICALQVLEVASIIGLIRRTQSLTGRVGTVAGVFGMFRRDAVRSAGGYDPQMATEDIDLTWRLVMDGWHTAYEPRALVGMEVPSTLPALWAQRKRWARGQGEVLHRHLRDVCRWRNRRMWLLGFESVASLVWVLALTASIVVAIGEELFGTRTSLFGFGMAWAPRSRWSRRCSSAPPSSSAPTTTAGTCGRRSSALSTRRCSGSPRPPRRVEHPARRARARGRLIWGGVCQPGRCELARWRCVCAVWFGVRVAAEREGASC